MCLVVKDLLYVSPWVEVSREAVVDKHSPRLAVDRHSTCSVVETHLAYFATET
jgi:hypothetical protein